MKKFISLCLALLLVLTLTACGGGAINAGKAQKIAAKDAGFKVSEISAHTHVVTGENGIPCYNIHFSADGEDYNYMISAQGEILSVSNESGH